ncbi:MAG: FISUMP domain-containing protein [Bacteroidota bacterium]
MSNLPFFKPFYWLLSVALISFTACQQDDDNTPVCALAATATAEAFEINVAATGGAAPYRYAIDGENFDGNARIEVEEATNYTVTVRDANDCEVTVEITGTSLEQFTDTRDNTTYRVIKIGDQVWLGENLRYNTNEGDFCYDDDDENCTKDGKLYTWVAAQEAVLAGWRIPSEADRNTLVMTLGGATSEEGEEAANTAMQPAGTSGWDDQFGGYFDFAADAYSSLGDGSLYWLSDEESAGRNKLFRVINSTSARASLGDEPHGSGLFVRLLKE